jgi:hypothetical protein
VARITGKPGGVDTDQLRKDAREALKRAGIHPAHECGGRYVDRLKWHELESVVKTGKLPQGHKEKIEGEIAAQKARGNSTVATIAGIATASKANGSGKVSPGDIDILGPVKLGIDGQQSLSAAPVSIADVCNKASGKTAGTWSVYPMPGETVPRVDVRIFDAGTGDVTTHENFPHTLEPAALASSLWMHTGKPDMVAAVYDKILAELNATMPSYPAAPDMGAYADIAEYFEAMAQHGDTVKNMLPAIRAHQASIKQAEGNKAEAIARFGTAQVLVREQAAAKIKAQEEAARKERERAEAAEREERGKEARLAALAAQEKAKENLLPGMRLATVDPTFVLSAGDKALFEGLVRIADKSALHHAKNVLNVGPAGCGKTEKAVQFAAFVGLPYVVIDCHLIREARDFFGAKGAENGTVIWKRSLFSKAVSAGNCVIVLNELNRAVPLVLNALLSILDDMRSAYIEEADELLTVGPYAYFFATANIGAEFTGTAGAIDSAIDSRFGVQLESSFLPQKDEAQLLTKRTGIGAKDAEKLAYIAAQSRSEMAKPASLITKAISTRTLLYAAEMFCEMGQEGLTYTLLNKFDAEERSIVAQWIQGQGFSR